MSKDTRSCYDFPRYYEIAFSFRDVAHEVDVIENIISLYSLCDGRNFLELACGPSQHMIELSRRGFHFHGLDINQNMLDYSRNKANAAGIVANFHIGSMVDFKLDEPIDFVFVALGDLYVKSSYELVSHLESVAAVLRTGGLFLLDWCIQFNPAKTFKEGGDTWEIAQGNIRVKSTVQMKPTSHIEQLFEECLDMLVDDDGTLLSLSSHFVKRAVYPQEFLALIEGGENYEFIGWWNNWSLSHPLTLESQEIFRPITLLRRR